VHFSRADGTERQLAEHRAKLCLLGLKELQKSWDLNYWVLEIFFHCLDESTAEYLQLSEEKNATQSTLNFASISTDAGPSSKHFVRNMQILPDTVTPTTISPYEQNQQQQQQEEVLKEQRPQSWSEMTPLSPPSNEVDIDLSEPFLFDEEFARNFGSCTPRLDALNSSNLDFLCRYL
jgi:hypothetical protein